MSVPNTQTAGPGATGFASAALPAERPERAWGAVWFAGLSLALAGGALAAGLARS